jgi:hypothetical protein
MHPSSCGEAVVTPGRDAHRVRTLRSAIATLGAAGATANARRALEHRQREDWLVAGLVHRVERRAGESARARQERRAAARAG